MKWRMRRLKQRVERLERKVKAKTKAKQQTPVCLVTSSPQELAFLAAIAEAPQEPAHRLAFTDWLEETVEASVLRDTVVAFHREWVGLHREPEPFLQPHATSGPRWRWLWRQYPGRVPGVCHLAFWFKGDSHVADELFCRLTAGCSWGDRRAYVSANAASADLLLAYLRRVNLHPVEATYGTDY